jgi:hypothetical protein
LLNAYCSLKRELRFGFFVFIRCIVCSVAAFIGATYYLYHISD